MFSVEVKNPCRCFLRNGMAEKQTFSTLEEAKNEAESMQQEMMRRFCKKHDFKISKSVLGYTITIVPST